MINVINVLGTSDQSWNHAAEEVVSQATETVEDNSGVDVRDWTATVEDGQISDFARPWKSWFR